MTEIPDVGICMRRVGPLHARNMASLAQRTKMSFNLIYEFNDGTCHQNMNRIIARSKSRWLCLLDDDLELLTDNWLEKLIATMERHPDVGFLGAMEIKTEGLKQTYLANPVVPFDILIQNWNAGMVQLYDRERFDVGEFPTAPEDIPGPTGASDIDMSWQVMSCGLKCALCGSVFIFHPDKPHDPSYAAQFKEEEPKRAELWREQLHYLKNRWGTVFEKNIQQQYLEICDFPKPN